MATITKSVEVAKETDELAQGLVSLVKNIQEAKADGWDSSQDIPAVLLNSLGDLSKAIEGADQVDNEAKDDLKSFAAAFYFAGFDIYDLLK